MEYFKLCIMTDWVHTHTRTHSALSKVCRHRETTFQHISFPPGHHRFFWWELWLINKYHHQYDEYSIFIWVTLYMRKISLIWSRVMLPRPNLSYSYKKENTSHFLFVKRKHLKGPVLLQISSVKGCVGPASGTTLPPYHLYILQYESLAL